MLKLNRFKSSRFWWRSLDRLKTEFKVDGLERMTQEESTRLTVFLMSRALNDLYRSVRAEHPKASILTIERKVDALLAKWERSSRHWDKFKKEHA